MSLHFSFECVSIRNDAFDLTAFYSTGNIGLFEYRRRFASPFFLHCSRTIHEASYGEGVVVTSGGRWAKWKGIVHECNTRVHITGGKGEKNWCVSSHLENVCRRLLPASNVENFCSPRRCYRTRRDGIVGKKRIACFVTGTGPVERSIPPLPSPLPPPPCVYSLLSLETSSNGSRIGYY